MSFRFYILLMLTATFLSWIIWGAVIFFVNPYEAGFLDLSFFYLSLFFALTGSFAVLGSVTRHWFSKEKILFRQAAVSFRQAIFFSVLIVVCLFLQSQRILNWWNILFLVAALSALELFAISKKRVI